MEEYQLRLHCEKQIASHNDRYDEHKTTLKVLDKNRQLEQELQQYKDENIRLNATIKNDELVVHKMLSEKQELITWLESMIDEDNYNPLEWVDYGDSPRYAVDKTIQEVLNKIKEVK